MIVKLVREAYFHFKSPISKSNHSFDKFVSFLRFSLTIGGEVVDVAFARIPTASLNKAKLEGSDPSRHNMDILDIGLCPNMLNEVSLIYVVAKHQRS